MTPEIPDGTWGFKGKTFALADIVAYVMGDANRGISYAAATLATRRRANAEIITNASAEYAV